MNESEQYEVQLTECFLWLLEYYAIELIEFKLDIFFNWIHTFY